MTKITLNELLNSFNDKTERSGGLNMETLRNIYKFVTGNPAKGKNRKDIINTLKKQNGRDIVENYNKSEYAKDKKAKGIKIKRKPTRIRAPSSRPAAASPRPASAYIPRKSSWTTGKVVVKPKPQAAAQKPRSQSPKPPKQQSKWLSAVKKGTCKAQREKDMYSISTVNRYIKEGDLDSVKYLMAAVKCDKKSFTYTAAEYGHISILKYLHERGCPWTKNTIYQAALNGHLECLKYAHQNGCDYGVHLRLIVAPNCLPYVNEKMKIFQEQEESRMKRIKQVQQQQASKKRQQQASKKRQAQQLAKNISQLDLLDSFGKYPLYGNDEHITYAGLKYVGGRDLHTYKIKKGTIMYHGSQVDIKEFDKKAYFSTTLTVSKVAIFLLNRFTSERTGTQRKFQNPWLYTFRVKDDITIFEHDLDRFLTNYSLRYVSGSEFDAYGPDRDSSVTFCRDNSGWVTLRNATPLPLKAHHNFSFTDKQIREEIKKLTDKTEFGDYETHHPPYGIEKGLYHYYKNYIIPDGESDWYKPIWYKHDTKDMEYVLCQPNKHLELVKKERLSWQKIMEIGRAFTLKYLKTWIGRSAKDRYNKLSNLGEEFFKAEYIDCCTVE